MATQAPPGLEPYLYQPLSVQECLFRLLRLLPGQLGDPIEIEVHTHSLYDPPFYETVSYHWGNQQQRYMILCEGCAIQVGENLFRILQSLRRGDQTRVLWIDAICIDQTGISEFNHTVKIMALIYKAAVRTLCWVKSTDVLRTFVSRTLELDQDGCTVEGCFSAIDPIRSSYRVSEQDLRIFHDFASQIDAETQHRVEIFLDQPYFQRLGVLQDIAYSHELTMTHETTIHMNYSDNAISLQGIAKALLMWTLFSPKKNIQATPVPFVVISEIFRRSRLYSEGATLGFADALLALYSIPSQCANTRDNIYRAHAITGSDVLDVKYEKSEDQVFLEATVALNESSRQPLSLSISDGSRRGLPSWCPDWTIHTTRLILNHAASDFAASPSSSDQYDMRSLHVQADATLVRPWILRGVVVDVVSETSTYCMPLRRHCDHYVVSGDNSAYVSFWLDFARDRAVATQSEDDLLLAFTNTIQARGCGHVWDDVTAGPQDRLDRIRKFVDFLENPDAIESYAVQLFYAASYASHGRKFGVTRNRRFCLLPEATIEGDLVCIPRGSRVPYIFRRDIVHDRHISIGEAFVNGIMHGEAYGLKLCDEQNFSLV